MPQVNRNENVRITVTLNGHEVSGNAEPRMLLSDFLREVLYTNTVHVGCEHGVCGACTVRVDGRAMRSCLMFAVQVDGCAIETAGGLADEDGELNPLQQAFKENHALQCGYCTPGILMSVTDYLERNPDPTEEEIKDMLSGHICRCTGYVGILRAVKATIAEAKGTQAKA
jgi:2-furoyl-CoA dehydrogenase 2Fe-2S iron sulfur subunit